jgi:hypothetical protein
MHSARRKAIDRLAAMALFVAVMFAGVTPLRAQGDDLPTAHVDAISPSPAEEGQAVQFRGHGEAVDAHSRRMAAYEWTSNIDGPLSESRTFVTRDLSSGVHTISFRVQDLQGEWSEQVWQTLLVGGSLPREADGDWDYWTNQPDMYLIPYGNVGIGTTEPTQKLDVRGDILSLPGPDLSGVQIGADGDNGKIAAVQKADGYWLARNLIINPHPFVSVGIGATSPEAKLDIDSGHVGMALKVDETLYVKRRNVGIGTANPESALHVNGAIHLDPISEPPAPSTGFVIYVDENDGGKLKAKSSLGTIAVLAAP